MLRQRKDRPRSNKRESFSPQQRRDEEVVLRLPMERPHYGEPSDAGNPDRAPKPVSRGSVDVDFYI
jgi:hypothetical protein